MPTSLSRRSFFRLATDSLFALPAVASGFLAVTPQEAYGDDDVPYVSDEDGGVYTNVDASAEVIVVNPWEVGFMLVDLADGGKSRIPGARVEVRSRYNKDKKTGGFTDSAGIVVLDISELAENDEHKDPKSLTAYAFNGSISVTCEGYRNFTVSLTRITGGGGLLIPGRNTKDAKPYPELVSFDEWDVLYTIESYSNYDKEKDTTIPEFLTFNSSPKNDRVHDLVVKMRNLPTSAASKVRLVDRYTGEVLLEKTFRPSQGVLTATFSSAFLKTGAANALPTDTDFDVHVEQNDITYFFPIKLRAKETIFPEPATVKNKVAKPLANIKNSTGGGSSLAFTLPPSFPLGKNDQLSMWLPEFPVNVYIDPSGYYQLSASTPSWGYKNDYGKEDEKGWQWFSSKSVGDQIESKMKGWDKLLDKTASAFADGDGFFNQVSYSRTFSFKGYLQFVSVGQWDSSALTFQGDAAGQFVIALAFTITEHFLAGPVPLFIQFDLKSSLTVSLGPGFIVTPGPNDKDWTDVVTNFSRYEWDFTNAGLTFTVLISPSLSIGVGLSGLASLSLRGNFTLTLFAGITGHKPEQPLPHLIAGYCFKADVVAQFFLWTYTWNVFTEDNPNWQDNWKESSPTAQALEDAIDPMATKSFDEIYDDVRPVSDEMLLASREFDGNTPITPQSEGPELYLDVQYKDDCVLDDGTVLTCAVYTMKVREQEGESAAAGQVAQAVEPEEALVEQALESDGAIVEQAMEPVGAMVEQAEDGFVLIAQEEASLGEGDATVDEALQNGELEATDEAAASPDEADATPNEEELLQASPFAYPIPGNYTPVYADEDGPQLVAMADTTPGIAGVDGIGSNGGIRPSLDMSIAKDIFGDPHIKCIEVEGTVYTLRIGSVTVNGKPLTRLIATVLSGYRIADAGARQVLDFNINPSIDGFDRSELCDLDFAAVPELYYEQHGMTEVSGWRMHVALVSAKRNTSDFAQAATDMVFTYVVFHHNSETGFDYVMGATSRKGGEVFTNTPEYPYHCLSNLDISFYEPSSTQHLATITYLDRMAASPKDVLNSENVKVRVGILFVPFSGYMDGITLIVPDPATIEQKMGPVSDLSAYELQFWPAVDGIYTFMIRGSEQSYFYVMRRDMSSFDSAAIQSVKQVGTTAASVRLHAWKIVNATGGINPIRVQQFLTCDENDRLCTAQVENPWDTKSATLRFAPQGADDFGIRSFGVWGDFVYWPEVRNGVPGHSFDEASGELVEMPVVNDCHIKASRLHGDHHSDPFIIADIGYVSDEDTGHQLDDIVSLSANNMALSILASELTDKEQDLATIWYLGIPFVKTVTALGATAVVPFVAPGKVTGFFLTLRNDGNTFLSGCEVAMYDRETMYDSAGALTPPAATCHLDFSKDTICESAWNAKDEDGNITGIEPDGSFAPGKTSVYRAEIVIPATWTSGRKEVVFVTRDATVVEGMAGQDESDEEIIEYSLPPANVMMDMLLIESPEWGVAWLDDSPVTVMANGSGAPDDGSIDGGGDTPGGGGGTPGTTPSGSNGTSGGTSGTSGSSGTTGTTSQSTTSSQRRTTLPSTGDIGLSPSTALLGAGLAAAGTIINAYERRRAENERQAKE